MPGDATPGGFELRDHTADLALFAWGDSLEALFASAAEGMYAAIGELNTAEPGEACRLWFAADCVESLLHDFLADLLFRFEVHGERLQNFVFQRLDARTLEADAVARRLQIDRCVLDREVKAVTYHDLTVYTTKDRLEVTIILDI